MAVPKKGREEAPRPTPRPQGRSKFRNLRRIFDVGSSGSGGVGGRGTGPRDGANFATCVVFLTFLLRTKKRKIMFFEGCPVGWGGYPPELAWWTGR